MLEVLVYRREEGGFWINGLTFFFDVLSLAGLCSFGDGFGEEGHELAIADGEGGC